VSPAAAPYRASGLVLWHKADQPIALGDVRFRGTSELALSTCDAARPSVAAAPLYPGWHRHRTVLADAAPRLLGGMGLRRGPRRATDTRTEWPANETGRRQGCSYRTDVACPDMVAAVLVADYFFFSVLNETPNRNATLRMRFRCALHDTSGFLQRLRRLREFDNATVMCKRPRLASHRWRAPLKTKPPAEYVR